MVDDLVQSDHEFDLDDVVSKLEGLRTLIVYDSKYVVRTLIFGKIIPQYADKRLFIAVYSDSMMRRLGKTYESIPDERIKRILDEAAIIKVGLNENVPFGKLHAYVNIHSEWWDDLIDELYKLGDSFLLFHGFSLLPIVYGNEAWKYLMDIFDALPDEITFVNKISSSLYDENVKRFMERFHDVILAVRREEDFFPVGRTYWIGVEQSIIFDIKPGYARYKLVGENLQKVE
ncbi:hypothetical protein [Ferroglobus sp.]|uniref:hypothetical protein n=1 Tax=Ferroglobus sp. TaxID=2614230 RepID=UPI0025C514DE|nr:hypothetical protein [Ferroglobus sp.]